MRRVHTQLSHLGIYAVVAATALTGGLVLARVLWTGRVLFVFLGWNLFLAWVPFVLGLLALAWVRNKGTGGGVGWGLVPLLVGWLSFLPNAPYLITDLIHLAPRAGVPLLYDAVMLGTAAVTGLLIGAVSMGHAQQSLAPFVGRFLATVVVASTAPLVGLGIYLGRFLRWNTWDLLLRPDAVIWSVAERVIDPISHPRTWLVTLLCSAVVWVAWAALSSLRTRAVAA